MIHALTEYGEPVFKHNNDTKAFKQILVNIIYNSVV